MAEFTLNRQSILNNPRVSLITDIVPIESMLDNIEKYINICFADEGCDVVQSGRVIAVRSTDKNRLSSAFKSAVYLGKWDDMDNRDRFLNGMVKTGHSYEPIRGEHVAFLFVGVGRPVYDHLITYSVGRSARISAGQRANLPWGYETPLESKTPEMFMSIGLNQVREVVHMVRGENEATGKQQIQAARSLLPVGFIMPPFLYEFSEEALVHIFQQRLWEPGAQGATKEVVADMLGCMKMIDQTKWDVLQDYHGPHLRQWNKVMRTLRDKRTSVGDLLNALESRGIIATTDEQNLEHIDLYDAIMTVHGNMKPSMWDKQQ